MNRIAMTPEEAKNKICPMIQPQVWQPHISTSPQYAYCKGPGCMLWAWTKGTAVEVASVTPGESSTVITKTGFCSV